MKSPKYACAHARRACQPPNGQHNSLDQDYPELDFDETTSHIVKRQDKGRTELFHAMVDKMVKWMNSNDTDLEIVTLVEDYL